MSKDEEKKEYKSKYRTKRLKKEIDEANDKIRTLEVMNKGLFSILVVMLIAFVITVGIADDAYSLNENNAAEVMSLKTDIATLKENQNLMAQWGQDFVTRYVQVTQTMLKLDQIYAEELGLNFTQQIESVSQINQSDADIEPVPIEKS